MCVCVRATAVVHLPASISAGAFVWLLGNCWRNLFVSTFFIALAIYVHLCTYVCMWQLVGGFEMLTVSVLLVQPVGTFMPSSCSSNCRCNGKLHLIVTSNGNGICRTTLACLLPGDDMPLIVDAFALESICAKAEKCACNTRLGDNCNCN